ncbi:unnamed protein product [Rangifer tarandus platyrhynchus]|uniref:Uncharacterized protein n=1 Tax=Rangifer tarandus platyrhynchus TaxID=3082113 RepID=A0AC59Z455_RANTA
MLAPEGFLPSSEDSQLAEGSPVPLVMPGTPRSPSRVSPRLLQCASSFTWLHAQRPSVSFDAQPVST